MGALKETALETLDFRRGELAAELKVAKGMKFNRSTWVTEGCMDLVEQGEPLSVEQMSIVGLPSTFHLARLRERVAALCMMSPTDISVKKQKKHAYAGWVRDVVTVIS